jgi:DNA-binding transcriptional MerR regulator
LGKRISTTTSKKKHRGNRVYSKKILNFFEKFITLVKEKGYTLDGAKNALRGVVEKDTSESVTNKLLRIRSELVSIASSL